MITVRFNKVSNKNYRQLPENSNYYVTGIYSLHQGTRLNIWRPPTDVFETASQLVIRVEIPGMRDDEFTLSMDQNLLTITGSRTDRIEDRSFHQMEVHFGPFFTQVEINTEVDVGKAGGEYVDGFLWVYLPKVSPQTIPINITK